MADPRAIRLRLCGLLLGLMAPAVLLAAVPPLRLSDLAVELNRQPAGVRADFAEIAVNAMADAFDREADNAQRADDARWVGGVDAYARQLRGIAGMITDTTPVTIRVSPERTLYLLIGDTPVIVSDPRVRRQRVMEQEILDRFCAGHDCASLIPARRPAAGPALLAAQGADTKLDPSDRQPRAAVAKPTPPPPPPVTPSAVQWSFGQSEGPACRTDDGLIFEFGSMRHLPAKRRACRQIVAEIDSLAARLGQYLAAGTSIDWKHLSLTAVPESDRQEIRLNRHDDTVVVRLPALARTPGLFARLRPWLAAKARGGHTALRLSDAEQLLAPLLSDPGT